jgi:hypothetical protein
VATPPVQQYVDTVNGLCDKLLPKVSRVTHGGRIDIPARQFLEDWPAHHLLVAFDKSLAALPVPPAACPTAAAMRRYTTFADRSMPPA